MDEAPLILTLKIDEDSQRTFDALREKYFPPARNFLRAHCTFFHALPGEHEARIQVDLHQVATELAPFNMQVGAPKFIGRGVAFPLEGQEAPAIHTRLQKLWRDWLTPQDRQGVWPHITVQNKVSPSEARATHNAFLEAFQPRTVTAMSLQLWYYLGGPWQEAGTFLFPTSRGTDRL